MEFKEPKSTLNETKNFFKQESKFDEELMKQKIDKIGHFKNALEIDYLRLFSRCEFLNKLYF